jgi:hypothetical protein
MAASKKASKQRPRAKRRTTAAAAGSRRRTRRGQTRVRRRVKARKTGKKTKRAAPARRKPRKVVARAARPKPSRPTPKSTRPAPKASRAAAPKASTPRKKAPRATLARRPPKAAGTGAPGNSPLERERRRLSDAERQESLRSESDARLLSSVRAGRDELKEMLAQHTESSPVLTAGDVDAKWDEAYAIGDEAPGGDNPTPDQDRVDDIGKALGVQYRTDEELQGGDEITSRDRHRWELDPASSDDWPHEDTTNKKKKPE